MSPMKPPAKESKSPFSGTYSLEHLATKWPLSVKEIRKLLATEAIAFIQIKGVLRVPKEAAQSYAKAHGFPTAI